MRRAIGVIVVLLVEERNGAGPDVIVTDEVPFKQLAGAGAIARYDVPDRAAFMPGAVDPGGLWAAAWIDTTVVAFNPARLRADGLTVPRSLDDFSLPAWKGKFALYTGGISWFLGVMQTRRDGDALLRKLANNAPLATTSHAATVTQIADGEADATPAAYGYYAQAEKRRGAPIDFVAPSPVFVTPNPVGLVANARHPAAARLLIDWLLSKSGQQFIVEQTGHVSARSDVANDPAVWDPKAPHVFVDIPPPDVLQAAIARMPALFTPGI
jgi:iron(III) transport system substrate-binding protein